MKKLKTQKGITLVALIVTVVVTLTLSVVAIGEVQNDGIIDHAKNARNEYQVAQNEVEVMIQNYVNFVNASTKPGTEVEEQEYEAVSVETDCIKYYADIDGNKEPDGIIYIDKANTVSGTWNRNSYTIENKTTGLKQYYISKVSHTTTAFGEAPVLSLIPGSKGEERFYVMALEDEVKDGNNLFSWYTRAHITDWTYDYSTLTTTGVGTGKTNTTNMKNEWLNNCTNKDNKDMWHVVMATEKQRWYIPSRDEWAAFGSAFGLKIGMAANYSTYGLSQYYCTSSQYNEANAFCVDFKSNYGINTGSLQSRSCNVAFRY